MAKIERESINFKLPKTLTNALRAKARQLNTTATDLVILGLEHVLDLTVSTDSSVENRLQKIEQQLQHLSARVETGRDSSQQTQSGQLSQQIQELASRLAMIESAVAHLQRPPSRGRSSTGYSYYTQPSVELQPRNGESLGKRLGVTVTTLNNQRSTNSQKEFVSWSRSRDPNSVGWRYEEKDKLYHPVKS